MSRRLGLILLFIGAFWPFLSAGYFLWVLTPIADSLMGAPDLGDDQMVIFAVISAIIVVGGCAVDWLMYFIHLWAFSRQGLAGKFLWSVCLLLVLYLAVVSFNDHYSGEHSAQLAFMGFLMLAYFLQEFWSESQVPAATSPKSGEGA